MPWLHLIFDAWEDHRRQRGLEHDQRVREELATSNVAAEGEDENAADNDGRKKKKRKHRK